MGSELRQCLINLPLTLLYVNPLIPPVPLGLALALTPTLYNFLTPILTPALIVTLTLICH